MKSGKDNHWTNTSIPERNDMLELHGLLALLFNDICTFRAAFISIYLSDTIPERRDTTSIPAMYDDATTWTHELEEHTKDH